MANALPWGFHRLSDVADQRVTDNIERVRTAVNEYVDRQNQLTQEIFGFLCEITTESQAKFRFPGAMELQGLTELGRPLPQRYQEFEYTVAWPLQKAGLALGQTYEQRIKMDIAGFAGLIDAIGTADTRWLRRHILAALFYNGAGWIHDDPDDPVGELTIKGLANGDTQLYTSDNVDNGATDNHYLAQAGDLLTASDPIPNIVAELTEHSINGGDVVILGSTLDRAKYAALADFYPERDANLRQGLGVTEFVGGVPQNVPGEFLGYHEANAYIFLWRGIPQNYMVGAVTNPAEKVLRQREHPEAQLRGFKPDADREDYPYFETDYVRRAGFGAWNRVGAVVQRFGNGTYAIPTNYGSPLQ